MYRHELLDVTIENEMLDNLRTFLFGNLIYLVDEHHKRIEAEECHDRLAIFFDALN